MAFTTVTEEKEKGKDEKRKKLHAPNAKRKGTTLMNALKNCLQLQITRAQVY